MRRIPLLFFVMLLSSSLLLSSCAAANVGTAASAQAPSVVINTQMIASLLTGETSGIIMTRPDSSMYAFISGEKFFQSNSSTMVVYLAEKASNPREILRHSLGYVTDQTSAQVVKEMIQKGWSVVDRSQMAQWARTAVTAFAGWQATMQIALEHFKAVGSSAEFVPLLIIVYDANNDGFITTEDFLHGVMPAGGTTYVPESVEQDPPETIAQVP